MSDYPLLTVQEQAVLTALRLDGSTVEPLRNLNPHMPDLIATYRGKVFLVRVPVLDPDEVVGLEVNAEQREWDAGWAGNVFQSADTNAVVSSILSTPEPTAPVTQLAAPAGLFAAPTLNFDAGVATQLTLYPGIWNTDDDALRATFANTQFASVELWFRWKGDATAPSGTTRNVGIILRETDANNAIEVLWQWAPSNVGIAVQRRVAGVVTAETSSAANIPAIPTDGKWHKFRIDLAGSVLTVRCDDINPIAWQGTLSGAAIAITGKPGVIETNGIVDFVLWCPQVPTTATIIRVDVSPQGNRPHQGINTVDNSENINENATYEAIIASGKTDRIRLVQGVTGFNTLAIKFKPEPVDRESSGLRSGLKGGSYQADAANRKCFQCFDGDRTRDIFKLRVLSGFPTQTNIYRLFWQYHQDLSQSGPSPRTGSSPPIQMVFKQHKTSGVYWVWFGLDGNYYNALGQSYESFQQADGSWPLGGEVVWNEILQFDHTYTFAVDLTHGSLASTDTETATARRGVLNSLTVDGVVKASNVQRVNQYGAFNFPDYTLYEGVAASASAFVQLGDATHELIPGTNSPLYGLTPS